MAYNRRKHLRDNIDAIRLSFALDNEQRKATETEKETLKNYSGFGGLKCILNPISPMNDFTLWSKSDLELFPLVKELHEVIRSGSGMDGEYKQYVESLKNSVLTAFYTPTEVVTTIAQALRENGIIPLRFLDPSAGMGEFVRAFEHCDQIPMCFEKDLLTGRILSHLHDNVQINGFEEIESRYNNYFDVVSSNIPFGELSVFDASYSKDNDRRQATKAIHNYFFMKGVDTLREGGVLAYITSQGVMNAPTNEPIRKMLMERADLVAAVRLPSNLFIDSAGTEVGSDLILLQKNSAKHSLSTHEEAFINGNYFNDTQKIVHTSAKMGTDPYGKQMTIYTHDEGVTGIARDMKKIITEDLTKNLNLEFYHSFYAPMAKKVESKEVKIESTITPKAEHPLITLYDLFGMKVEPVTTKKKNTTWRQTRRPPLPPPKKQPSLFDNEIEEIKPIAPKTIAKPTIRNQTTYNRTLFDERATEDKIVTQPPSLEPRAWIIPLETYHKNGTLVVDHNTSQIGYLTDVHRSGATFKPIELNHVQTSKVKAYSRYEIVISDFFCPKRTAERSTPPTVRN